MAKCRDGVELPSYGNCSVCGASAWQECLGRSYAEYMKAKAALDDAKREHGWAMSKDWQRDRRLPR